MRFRITLISILIGLVTAPVSADTPVDVNEPFMSNTRLALDIFSRRIRNLDTNEWYSQDSFGLDFHKVFTGSNGDYGTLILQPSVIDLNNFPNPPFFFDDEDDTQLVWRIANFNYTGLSQGGFNLRVGHFEIPFGLEQNIDTNSTLRQFTFADRGIKLDWGVSVNGNLPKFDYEFALSRGSSNEYLDRDNPFIISGRIGTPSYKNTVYGISYFYGNVLADDETIKRKHIGLDFSHYINQWELLSEFSAGENADDETINWLSEVSWRNIPESLHLYVQTRSSLINLDSSWEDGFSSTLGLNWKFSKDFSLSSQLVHEFSNPSGVNADTTAVVQLRLRI